MGRTPWATYLWPGLPQLSRCGDWSGLAVAFAYAALLNLTIMATLVWTELLSPGVRNVAWVAVVVVWVGSALLGYGWEWWHQGDCQRGTAETSFRQAINHYLKGDWFETQRVLAVLLRQDPKDIEARLMLATLLRHTGRLDEAEKQLDMICRLDGSERWELEIQAERQLLAEARTHIDNGEQSGNATNMVHNAA